MKFWWKLFLISTLFVNNIQNLLMENLNLKPRQIINESKNFFKNQF